METHRQQSIERTSLKIGDYEVCPIPTGLFGLDGGAMFGTVPRVLWEKSIPPDEKNRIPMEARALLLKSENHKILIDCGNGGSFIAKYGEKLGTKFAEMYGVQGEAIQLQKSIEKFNVRFDEITDVILTHLHFDHAGGGVTEKNGKLVPTFPNAKYYIQKKNLETAQSPNIREKASYLSANYQPLIDAQVLQIIDGNIENLLPQVSVRTSHGHTVGQQMVLVGNSKERLLYCDDVIPTSAHVRLAWIMGYDLDPLQIISEKEKILKEAAHEKWYLFFEHDPYCDGATVVAKNGDFAVENKFLFS